MLLFENIYFTSPDNTVLSQNWEFMSPASRANSWTGKGGYPCYKMPYVLLSKFGGHIFVSPLKSRLKKIKAWRRLSTGQLRASSSSSYCPQARNKHQNWKLIFCCLWFWQLMEWTFQTSIASPYLLGRYLGLFSVVYTSLFWTCLKYHSFHNRFMKNVCGKLQEKLDLIYFFCYCLVQYLPWQRLHPFKIFS